MSFWDTLHSTKNTWHKLAVFFIFVGLFTNPIVVTAESRIFKSASDDLFDLELKQLLDIKVVAVSRSVNSNGSLRNKVVVVTKDQIRRREYHNLLDLLDDQLGNEQRMSLYRTVNDQVAARSADGSGQFVVQRNGVAVRVSAVSPAPKAKDFLLFNVLRVEIIYRRTSGFSSSGAFSGVINVITKRSHQHHLFKEEGHLTGDGYY